MKKKIGAILLATCLVSSFGLASAGCNKNNDDGGEAIDPNRTQLYVNVRNCGIGTGFVEDLKAAYEKKNPKAQIMITTNDNYDHEGLQALKVAEKVDVVFAPNFILQDLVSINNQTSDLFADITDIVTEGAENSIMAKMYREEKDYHNIGTENQPKFYSLPWYVSYHGTVYDVDLFEEKGFYEVEGYTGLDCTADTEDDYWGPDGKENTYDDGLPATWEDMKLLMDEMVGNNITPFTWTSFKGYSDAWLSSVWANYEGADNYSLLTSIDGTYPPPPGCPEWPGLEVAGVIKEVAKDVTQWKVGDKVCALLGGGGYAEYVAVPAEMVMPIPKGLSYAEAAAIPEVYMTAYLNLFYVGQAKQGETLLMNAGASGLASAVIPMAKAFGLRVITTVLGEEKVKEVAYLNADRVVDTTKEDIAEVLKEEEQKGMPVNLAIDCLAGEALGRCLKYVARGCRWIQIATLAGDMSNVDFRNIFVKNIRIIGSTLRSKTPEEKGRLLSELVQKTWCKFENGEIKVKIHKTLPIQEADEAQQILYRGENVGKVVLIVKE